MNNPLKTACQIASQTLKTLKAEIKPGQSEKQLAAKAKRLFIKQGADSPAFPLIIAFGPHSATPHHVPTVTKLKQNDVVLIDIGCKVRGYCSDITRTFTIGNPPKKFKAVEKAVLSAYQAALDKMESLLPDYKTSPCNLVDAAARKVITKAGFGPYFIHSTGHGVGKKVHQKPTIGPKSKDILKTNTVITIEPGIYLKNHFGYRHENTIIITNKDYHVLTA